jgi:hypothetical protein
MKANVGSFDGWFRILLFIISLGFAVLSGGSVWLWVIPTGILFLTAVLTWCPLYDVLGISTNKE